MDKLVQLYIQKAKLKNGKGFNSLISTKKKKIT